MERKAIVDLIVDLIEELYKVKNEIIMQFQKNVEKLAENYKNLLKEINGYIEISLEVQKSIVKIGNYSIYEELEKILVCPLKVPWKAPVLKIKNISKSMKLSQISDFFSWKPYISQCGHSSSSIFLAKCNNIHCASCIQIANSQNFPCIHNVNFSPKDINTITKYKISS